MKRKMWKKKNSPHTERVLVQNALHNRHATSCEFAHDLRAYGLDVTPSTVRRHQIKGKLPARKPCRKAKLTPAMARKRLARAKHTLETFDDDWTHVSFALAILPVIVLLSFIFFPFFFFFVAQFFNVRLRKRSLIFFTLEISCTSSSKIRFATYNFHI